MASPLPPSSPDQQLVAELALRLHCDINDFALHYNQQGYLIQFGPKIVGPGKRFSGSDVPTRSSWRALVTFPSFPPEILSFQYLQSLFLSYQPELTVLPEEIGQLSHLESLSLGNCSLQRLPAEIGQLGNLQHLNVSDNALQLLPASLGQLRLLQSLDLSNNQLRFLPDEIGLLISLRVLNIQQNQLDTLPSGTGHLQGLLNFMLANNHLSTLPASLGLLTQLEYLDLSYNHLSTLPASLGLLTNLVSLDLSHNYLTSLPPEMSQLNNLGRLKISDNLLSQLPSELGNLPILSDLDLENNQLTAFPQEFPALKHISFLKLDGNPLVPALSADLKQTSIRDFEVNAYHDEKGNTLHPQRVLYDEIDVYYSSFGLIDIGGRLLDEIPEGEYGEGRAVSDYIDLWTNEQFPSVWVRMEAWLQTPPAPSQEWTPYWEGDFFSTRAKLQLTTRNPHLSSRTFSLGEPNRSYRARIYSRQRPGQGSIIRGEEQFLCQFWPA